MRLLAVLFAFAQPPAGAPAVPADLHFHDGSILRVALEEPNVTVQTRYGKLTVPLAEVRRIDLGLHFPAGAEAKIRQAVSSLSSTLHRDREHATRELTAAGPLAYAVLKDAKPEDLEARQRIAAVMQTIRANHGDGRLNAPAADMVHADFAISGRILEPSLKAASPHIGSLTLKLSDLRTIVVGGDKETELTIDAATHGSGGKWLETDIALTAGQRLLVTADGQVDLWPQGPGQYMSTPKGYTTAGKDSTFMAGSLIGKIGEGRAAFLIADRHEAKAAVDGKLYLQIVASPWNNASTGSYRVRLKTAPR